MRGSQASLGNANCNEGRLNASAIGLGYFFRCLLTLLYEIILHTNITPLGSVLEYLGHGQIGQLGPLRRDRSPLSPAPPPAPAARAPGASSSELWERRGCRGSRCV